MQFEEKRGYNPEVAAAAAQRPEEIGVFLLVRSDEAAVGQHNVGLQQVVDGQPQLTGEVPDAAAERDASGPSCGDDAAGSAQVERLLSVVQLPQLCFPMDAGG